MGPKVGEGAPSHIIKVSIYSCQCASRLHVACHFHAKVSFSAFRSLIRQEKGETSLLKKCLGLASGEGVIGGFLK